MSEVECGHCGWAATSISDDQVWRMTDYHKCPVAEEETNG